MTHLRNGTPAWAPEPEHRVPDRTQGYQLADVTDVTCDITPTERFYQDFPDGVVPIIETRHIMPVTDSPHQALLDTLTVFEYEHKREEMRRWWLHENRRERIMSMDWSEKQLCRAQVREWLAEGVSPLTITQSAGVSMRWMCAYWSADKQKEERDWQGIWEAMWKGQCIPMTKQFRIGPNSLRHFAVLCGAWWSMKQTLDYCERTKLEQFVPIRHTLARLNLETPSPQYTYGTLMSHRCREVDGVDTRNGRKS